MRHRNERRWRRYDDDDDVDDEMLMMTMTMIMFYFTSFQRFLAILQQEAVYSCAERKRVKDVQVAVHENGEGMVLTSLFVIGEGRVLTSLCVCDWRREGVDMAV